MKTKILLIALLLLIISGIVFICYTPDTLPLDVDNADGIRFKIIPQDDRNYTLTDDNHVKAIVNTINELDFLEGNQRPDRASDNYYYFRIHIKDKDITVELDEYTISIDNEIYQADTSELCILLEQTCYDIINGIIE